MMPRWRLNPFEIRASRLSDYVSAVGHADSLNPFEIRASRLSADEEAVWKLAKRLNPFEIRASRLSLLGRACALRPVLIPLKSGHRDYQRPSQNDGTTNCLNPFEIRASRLSGPKPPALSGSGVLIPLKSGHRDYPIEGIQVLLQQRS